MIGVFRRSSERISVSLEIGMVGYAVAIVREGGVFKNGRKEWATCRHLTVVGSASWRSPKAFFASRPLVPLQQLSKVETPANSSGILLLLPSS